MAVFKKNGEWWIDYYVNGQRRREKVGHSKTLADNALRKKKVQIAEGKFLDVRRQQKLKFEDFADEYLELHSKVNNKSWRRTDRHNINMLKRYFSGKCLYEITPHVIEQFKSKHLQKASPSRVNRLLATLKSIFNRAKAWDKFLGDNPVCKVQMFKVDNSRVRYLEKEEIAKLIECCSGEVRSISILALNTGMRLGEIFSLRWRDVDIKRRYLYLYNTKNGEKREVAINEQTEAVLIKTRKNPKSEYVFPNREGGQRSSIRNSFCKAVKKAGLVDFRFHDLRHTFASHLAMSGVDLNTIRELLGHKSMSMTLRYSHLSRNHKQQAVDTLSGMMDTIWSPKEREGQREKGIATVNT